MVGMKVPENNPVWQTLLMLHKITKIVLAPKVAVPHLALLDTVLQDHACLFTEIFPEAPFKPKQHYILHYPQLSLDFGPLRSAWCMHYEAKDYFFKMLVNCMRNFKNLCKTVATRHQMQQAFFLSNGFLHGKVSIDSVGKCKLGSVALSDSHLQSRFERLGICITQIQSVECATINGTTYRCGAFVADAFLQECIVFGKITAVPIHDTAVLFLVDKYLSHFDEHFECYQLACMGISDIIPYKNLADWYL